MSFDVQFQTLARGFLVIVLGSVIVMMVLSNPIDNTDTWKHLVDGKYLYTFGHFPHYSTFTFAPVSDTVSGDSLDWLASLLLFLTYHVGGYAAMHLWKWISPLPVLFLIWCLFDRKFNVFWFIVSLVVFLTVFGKMDVRAAGFSVFFSRDSSLFSLAHSG